MSMQHHFDADAVLRESEAFWTRARARNGGRHGTPTDTAGRTSRGDDGARGAPGCNPYEHESRLGRNYIQSGDNVGTVAALREDSGYAESRNLRISESLNRILFRFGGKLLDSWAEIKAVSGIRAATMLVYFGSFALAILACARFGFWFVDKFLLR